VASGTVRVDGERIIGPDAPNQSPLFSPPL